MGTGGDLSEGGERGGKAASKTTYESSVEGGGEFMVEFECRVFPYAAA